MSNTPPVVPTPAATSTTTMVSSASLTNMTSSLTSDTERFFVLSSLLLDATATHLRDVFKTKWVDCLQMKLGGSQNLAWTEGMGKQCWFGHPSCDSTLNGVGRLIQINTASKPNFLQVSGSHTTYGSHSGIEKNEYFSIRHGQEEIVLSVVNYVARAFPVHFHTGSTTFYVREDLSDTCVKNWTLNCPVAIRKQCSESQQRQQGIPGFVHKCIKQEWMMDHYRLKVCGGDTDRWDISLLSKICRAIPGMEGTPLMDKIQAVADVRNTAFGHLDSTTINSTEYDKGLLSVKSLLGDDALNDAFQAAIVKMSELGVQKATYQMLDSEQMLNEVMAIKAAQEAIYAAILQGTVAIQDSVAATSVAIQDSTRAELRATEERLQTALDCATDDFSRVVNIQTNKAVDRVAYDIKASNEKGHDTILGAVKENTAILTEQRITKIKKLLQYPDIFTADIQEHLERFQPGSREWMHEEVNKWLSAAASDDPATPCVFWVKGEAGMGKSAFAASVVKRLEQSSAFLGAFFCRFGDSNRTSPDLLVRSLAAQCAAHVSNVDRETYFVPAFEAFPFGEPGFTTHDMLKKLLLNPLTNLADGKSNMPRMVLVIDALDEAGADAKQRLPLLNCLSELIRGLPASRVQLLLTSRPELDIMTELSTFKPLEIQEDDARHKEDINLFVSAQLKPLVLDTDHAKVVELFMKRSQGRFVYVATVMDEINERARSRQELLTYEELLLELIPDGLDASYRRNFTRMRDKNRDHYDSVTVKLLHLIVAAQVPLSLKLATELLCPNILVKLTQSVNQLKTAMFPVRIYNGEECFLPFHKTVIDWLIDNSCSGNYNEKEDIAHDLSFFVDPIHGHTLYAETLWKYATKWLEDPSTCEDIGAALGREGKPAWQPYFLAHGVKHLWLSGKKEEAVYVCFRLRFLQAAVAHVGVNECIAIIKWLSQEKGVNDATTQRQLKLLYQLLTLSAPGLSVPEHVLTALPTQILCRLPEPLRNQDANPLLYQLYEQSNSWQCPAGLRWLKPTHAFLIPPGTAAEFTILTASFVRTVAVLPDGSIVSGSKDKTVRVWNASTGECLYTLKGHTDEVTSVAVFSVGNCIASGSKDKTVRVWNAITGKCLYKLEGHTDEVTSVAVFSAGNRIVSGSKDQTVCVWDVKDVNTMECLYTLKGHTGEVTSVAVSSAKDRIVSGSSDHTVRVWDASGDASIWHCVRKLEGHEDWVNSVAVSSAGDRIVSGSGDRTVRVWDASGDASTWHCVHKLEGHDDLVYCVAMLSAGDRIVSGSGDRTVRVWDASTGNCVKTLLYHRGRVRSLVISSTGNRIVSGSFDKTVRVWDASAEECLHALESHTNYVNSVAMLSAANRIVSGSWDKTVRVWNASTGECLYTLVGHTGGVNSVAVSSAGDRIVSGSWDKTVRVWTASGDASTWHCQHTLAGHDDVVYCLAMSSAGDRIVSGSFDKTVCVWNTITGECLYKLDRHKGEVTSVAVFSAGNRIVSGSRDKTVCVWNASTGECLYTLVGHTGWVNSVAVSSAGDRIVSGSYNCILRGSWDKTVRVWEADTGKYLETITDRSFNHVLHEMDYNDNGSAFLHDLPYPYIDGVCQAELTTFRQDIGDTCTYTSGPHLCIFHICGSNATI